jgi:hypothetical protein
LHRGTLANAVAEIIVITYNTQRPKGRLADWRS